MRVFVTGASGFVGSAVVQELIAAGHQVLGLARSDASAQALIAAGADAHRGDIDDLESLKQGAAQCDGVIHTAFNHDFSKYKANCEADRHIIIAMGSVLEGSQRPLIVTSGTALVAGNGIATEDSKPAVTSDIIPRLASDEAAAVVAARGVNVSVVRLSPSVHGDGDHGFVPTLINIAREKGIVAYVNEGANRWPAVHRLDAARLYRLALEKGAANAIYHGAAEEGVPMREIAEVISKHLNVPAVSQTPEEAAAHFDWIAHFVAIDNPTSFQKTKHTLGWEPTHVSLLEDLENGTYFQS
ncbi:SDR family oxidoreductase [Mucilaginibacter terrenus]|uniref:SDR family oxidoreductase n=1 Tax=Mucilaginibacter terrenus TaxID=2482727 RepID=A0A3E2NL53_9SPHI|nr:SDR family oxidoreductase [Mucilaginibacter terrenus]RFZ81734.1 SDR family oxidoreductase [Mucilaginibacter terrenus]